MPTEGNLWIFFFIVYIALQNRQKRFDYLYQLKCAIFKFAVLEREDVKKHQKQTVLQMPKLFLLQNVVDYWKCNATY